MYIQIFILFIDLTIKKILLIRKHQNNDLPQETFCNLDQYSKNKRKFKLHNKFKLFLLTFK